MRRGTIFILLFILVAAGVIIAGKFVSSQPPLEITVAVDPLVEEWAQNAIKALNDTQPMVNTTRRIQFKVTAIDDLDVWNGRTKWTQDNHPQIWLASSSASVSYAQTNGLPLVGAADSLARTPLVWGGYVSRVNVVTQEGALHFDWTAVTDTAKAVSWKALAGGDAGWGFIKLGFAQPDRKMGGVAALLSAAGTFNQSGALGQNAINAQAFRDWLKPVVDARPSFYIRGDPMDAMTSGPSTLEIALLPETMFLNRLNGLLVNEQSRFRFSYPAYQFQLDFPLVSWQDSQTTPDETAAVQLLSDWLTNAAQQTALAKYGLRPAAGEPKLTDDLFAAAVPYGLQLIPDYGQAVQTPSLNDVQGLLQWVSANQ
jgi:hypothetical protein